MAKSSSGAGSKKQHKLAEYSGSMVCKGTRGKPLGGSYDCRQVLGIVGKNGVSIKCRRCKTIMEFTWKDLKLLREKVLKEGKRKR